MSNYILKNKTLYKVNNKLYHHGILGQKWGVRNYQNTDGSLTPEGRERYVKGVIRKIVQMNKDRYVYEKNIEIV